VIRVHALHKRFGSQPVLRGIDLDIATGEISKLDAISEQTAWYDDDTLIVD